MADYSYIAGQAPQPINPLQTLSGWADYANKLQQNRNMVLQNQTGQQALGQTMAMRHAQIMYGLSSLPDDQIGGAAEKALDDELASGQIDQQRYDVMKQHIDNATPGQIRQTITAGIVGNLAGPDAIKALTGTPTAINNGGQFQGGVQAGPLSGSPGALQGSGPVYQQLPSPQFVNTGGQTVPTSGGQQVGGGLTNTPSPQFVNTGGAAVPTSGGLAIGGGIASTLSPGQATDLQSRLVQQPDGSYQVVTKQLGQWNPAVAPAGLKPGAPGALGGGNYPGPATTTVPQGQESQLTSDQTAYQADKQAVPSLITGTQSLNKALSALNAVATGAGTQGLANMRALAVSLGNVVGVDTGGVNIQDMNRAELSKYLTDYARQSGTAGRSDQALEAAFKSNASGEINNAAAQDVVRTNIGRDRQKVAATMTQQNPQGANYTANKATFNNNTDPRGFAWDTYSPQQQKEIMGSVKEGSPEQTKLLKAIGIAARLKLTNSNPQLPTNVNAAPQGNQLNGQQ